MFPGDLELELDGLFENHGVTCRVIENMLTLQRAVYQRCTPAQLPLSDRQRFHIQKCVASCKTSLSPFSRLTVLTSLFSSWTSPMCGLKGETTTLTSSTFSSWLPLSTYSSKRIPCGHWILGTLAEFPICWRQSQDSSPGARATTHRRCTQRGQFSKLLSAECHILKVLNYDLTTPTPAAQIEIFERRLSLFGKNTNSNSRTTRTFRVRHPSCSLTVRISLQRPMFETILCSANSSAQ